MSKITNLKELEERRVLQREDIVIFIIKEKIIKYKVNVYHLDNLKKPSRSEYNDEIFRILKINKAKIIKKAYGENLVNPNTIIEPYWGTLKKENFPALTRLVKELYLIIEKPVNGYTKFTRFEIMEI